MAFRLTFPERSVIICGGRQITLRSLSPLLFAAGADSLMTGDYLTTQGRLPDDDRQMLEDLGLELVQEKEIGVLDERTTEAKAPDLSPLIR
jgi:biotin synthase